MTDLAIDSGRALAVGIITAPFISAGLLALGRTGRALTHTIRNRKAK